MFSATSASAFSCAYCRVRLKIAVCNSACSSASRGSSARRLWKSSWSFSRLLPDSFVDECSSLSCQSASSCSTWYCFRDSSRRAISDSRRVIASLVRSPSRTRPLTFSSPWSISLFSAMICLWMFSTFASLFLLGRELGLVTFVFCDLLSGPDDLPLDQFAVLVRELGLRRRQALVQVPIFQRAIPVRLELFDLLVDLVEDDSDPIEVLLGLLPLAFRLVDVVVELRDSRDVVEDSAPFHGGHGDDPLDVPLLDEVVPFRRDSRVGEEGVEFGQGGLPVVDVEVRVVAALHGGAQADVPSELDLVRFEGNLPVRVVEDQTHLARVGGVLVLSAIPDEVRQLARADRLRTLRAEDEQDGVRDVALPRAVGTRDGRVPLEERDRDLSPERLEILHLDLFQEQGRSEEHTSELQSLT